MDNFLNNRLNTLLQTFLQLNTKRNLSIYLKESIIRIQNRMAHINNNVIYIKEEFQPKYPCERECLILVSDSNINNYIDNKFYLKLLRKRNKFKEELISTIEKELLK